MPSAPEQAVQVAHPGEGGHRAPVREAAGHQTRARFTIALLLLPAATFEQHVRTTAGSFSCLLRVQDQSHVPGTKVPPTSDEYVLDLVSRCEERLLKLQEELRKQAEAEHTDLEAALRQLEDEDVRSLLLAFTDLVVPFHFHVSSHTTVLFVVLQFRSRMETNLPQYNIRIKLPSVKKDGRFEGKIFLNHYSTLII